MLVHQHRVQLILLCQIKNEIEYQILKKKEKKDKKAKTKINW